MVLDKVMLKEAWRHGVEIMRRGRVVGLVRRMTLGMEGVAVMEKMDSLKGMFDALVLILSDDTATGGTV